MGKKNLLARVLLAAWVSVWAVFLVRPYVKRDLLRTYGELVGLSLEDKRAYVTGRELYGFITDCKSSVEPGSTYSIAGLDKVSLEAHRAAYYLYPDTASSDPDFVFVYNVKGFSKRGYRLFREFAADKYILKKGT